MFPEQLMTSVEGRALATALVVFAGLLWVVVVQRLQRWLTQRSRPLLADILASVLLVSVALLLAGALLRLWEQFDAVTGAAVTLDADSAVVAQLILSGILLMGTYILTRFVHRLLGDVIGSSGTASVIINGR
ncbi:MAG: hypothetical protein U5K37_04780 [Natrialbaceae archaeon]|nr:hypothetical protein [Natrialbaceae archaeon]